MNKMLPEVRLTMLELDRLLDLHTYPEEGPYSPEANALFELGCKLLARHYMLHSAARSSEPTVLDNDHLMDTITQFVMATPDVRH